MRKFSDVLPLNISALTTLLLVMMMLAFVDEGFAGTSKLVLKHDAAEITAICDRNGGYSWYDPDTSHYGCVGKKGSVICDQDKNCYGTCAACGKRLVGPFLKGVIGRPSGVTTVAMRATTRPTYCQWCYASCPPGPGGWLCRVHCQTRGGCPPRSVVMRRSR